MESVLEGRTGGEDGGIGWKLFDGVREWRLLYESLRRIERELRKMFDLVCLVWDVGRGSHGFTEQAERVYYP